MFSPAGPPPITITSNCSIAAQSPRMPLHAPDPASDENDAMTTVLGIDIGGTGIKGAPVDTRSGQLLADRHRILTPHPATPDAVTDVVARAGEVLRLDRPHRRHVPRRDEGRRRPHRGQRRPVVDRHRRRGACSPRRSAATVTVVNDADAAGVAEMTFGVGKGRRGVVIMITLGTGIGSALFIDGTLVPNTELGHLKMGKHDAEHLAADSVRETHEPVVEGVGGAPRGVPR